MLVATIYMNLVACLFTVILLQMVLPIMIFFCGFQSNTVPWTFSISSKEVSWTTSSIWIDIFSWTLVTSSKGVSWTSFPAWISWSSCPFSLVDPDCVLFDIFFHLFFSLYFMYFSIYTIGAIFFILTLIWVYLWRPMTISLTTTRNCLVLYLM